MQARQAGGGIDAALEAVARIRHDARHTARACGAQWVEPGRFEEDIHGLGTYRRAFPAHHTAQADHAAIVGNDAHVGHDLIGLAIKRGKRFARAAKPGDNGAFQLCRVIGVQWARAVERDIVGDVHQ